MNSPFYPLKYDFPLLYLGFPHLFLQNYGCVVNKVKIIHFIYQQTESLIHFINIFYFKK